MDHDQLFKELLRTFLPEFVSLFLPAEAEQIDWSSLELLDKELFTDLLQGTRRSVDLVARVRTVTGAPELLLVHVEVEAAPRAEFPQRMYEYYSLLRLRHRLPVLPIAVFLQPPAGGAESSYEEYVFGLRTIRFEYHLLVLPQVRRASLPDTNPVTHALTPLVAGRPEDPVELTLTALSGIAHTATDPARQALLGSFVGAYVRLNPEQQADLTRRLADNENQEVRAMLTHWHEQGLELGREQGLERGIRQSIRRVLERRLGPIPPQVQEALEEITDTETLDDLTGVAATATSYAEFETALQRGA
jgi:hypothetical protein